MKAHNSKLRLVVIAGRPNVGKSSIFNRLAGKRIAVVHSESGVTRDRLIHEASWHNERFSLVDTGGISKLDGTEPSDIIQAAVIHQVKTALEDASAVILVTDIQTGIHPLDQEVAAFLRQYACPTAVAANKADAPEKDSASADFETLGFPVFPVSALHNRGFDKLIGNILPALPPPAPLETTTFLRLAIVGRPNVGKSSLVNAFLGSDRVIVSEQAGTTRDAVDIPFTIGKEKGARHYMLVDTPGLRKKSRVSTAVETFASMRAEQSVAQADIAVLVIDTMQGPTAFDKRIAALINEHRKGAVIIVNKWDLASGVKQKDYREALLREMPFMKHCPVVFVSALSGSNVHAGISAVDTVASQVGAHLPTAILNRAIADAFEKNHPPSSKGRILKFFYATQVGFSPLRIRLFVNHPEIVAPSYAEYLTASLRRKFGLEGAPVVLQFKPRRKERL